MKKLFILFLFLNTSASYSQQYSPEWTARFNARENSFDFATKMFVDSAGNVYVTGKSFGDGTDYDYSTIKYNTSGVFQWEARYNGPANFFDEPTGIAVDKLGNVFVTGFSYGGSSDYDYATVKYSSSGVQQWVDRYNGPADSTDNGNSICVDSSGNIYVTGESRKLGGINSNSYDCVTIKYNSSGIRIWTRSYEYQPGSEDFGKLIRVDFSGNVYVVGNMYYSLLSLKYSNTGTLQWAVLGALYGNVYFDLEITSVAIDIGNNLYVSGRGSGFGGDSGRVIKYNAFGVKEWMYAIYDYKVNSISVDSSGNSYTTGITSGPGGYDIASYKYNSFGLLDWKAKYNGNGNLQDYAISSAMDISGNVYICGYSYYPSTYSDYITLKYSSSGINQWTSRYFGAMSPLEDQPQAIALNESGNVFVTGYSVGIGTEYDYLTIKYPSSLQMNATILIEGFYNENNNRLNKKDTLTAYIRNTTSPFSIVDSGKAVVDTLTFRCGFCFNSAPAGTYYITIKHRNSIETWSKAGGELFSKSIPTYFDFTITNTQAYGNRLKLKGSKYCIYSGDADQSGFIDVGDLIQIFNDAKMPLTGNFLPADLNGDLIVDAADLILCYNTLSSYIGVARP